MSEDELEQQILQVVKDIKPNTIRRLIQLVQQSHNVSEKEIIKRAISLRERGLLDFTPSQTLMPSTFTAYLGSGQAAWYWITVAMALATTTVTFTIAENAYPLVYLRYVLGATFVLWLPGYTFIKALFPAHTRVKTSGKSLDTVERIALSLGMSLALVPITGLLLNYTPWGIRLAPITLSLLTLTMAFATTALIREYRIQVHEEP